MWLLIVWLLPILIMLYLKYNNLEHGTISDMFKKPINPFCTSCGCCDNGDPNFDWLIPVPFLGALLILATLLHKPIRNLWNTKIK